MSTPIIITGAGAVSPAGWDREALARAVSAGAPLPVEDMVREDAGMRVVSRVRRVPANAPGGPTAARSRPWRAAATWA